MVSYYMCCYYYYLLHQSFYFSLSRDPNEVSKKEHDLKKGKGLDEPQESLQWGMGLQDVCDRARGHENTVTLAGRSKTWPKVAWFFPEGRRTGLSLGHRSQQTSNTRRAQGK
jgi:hypothetical protein